LPSSVFFDDKTADAVTESMTLSSWPTESDANIIYYVSGAIARSVVRTMKCSDCKELLIDCDQPMQPLEPEETTDYSAESFFNSINRGGLCRPSSYCFMTAVHCWRVYESIRASTSLKSKLLGAGNQRHLFVAIMERATDSEGQVLAQDNFCVKGHDLRELITIRFFNCVAKNLAKEITTAASLSSQHQSAKKRKIAKLTGKLQSC